MKIKLQDYNKLKEKFEQKGYSEGITDNLYIYYKNDVQYDPDNLKPGYYVYAIEHGKIEFKDVPERCRTRSFFLHTLSGVNMDIVEYVKEHPEDFNKQFFKDHIATNYYALKFRENDFEYMPLEFIDEEMVEYAMLKTVEKETMCDGKYGDWFYSIHRRKPEVLTQEIYILGARYFAKKINGENKFLEITPKEYRTQEYYFSLCLKKDTPVMEDVPIGILTTDFLVALLKNLENIRSFSEEALERKVKMRKGILKLWRVLVIHNGYLETILKLWKATICNRCNKLWQIIIIYDGYKISKISLNDERIKFFLSIYNKDSSEYKYYNEYVKSEKN